MSRDLINFAARLIDIIEDDSKKHNTTVRFDESAFTTSAVDSVGSSGYFDDATRTLAVATYKPMQEWITTLAHEYCHMTQFVHGAKAWTDLGKDYGKGESATNVTFDWLNGIKHGSTLELLAAINTTMMVEFDCEKKTVGLMQFMGAPIDLEVYTQKALAYVCFYHAVKKYRTWYDPLNPPYSNEAVWSKMPKTFDFDITDSAKILAMTDFTLCFPKDYKHV